MPFSDSKQKNGSSFAKKNRLFFNRLSDTINRTTSSHTSRYDENFNRRSKVAIESSIAEEIINHPTKETFQAIQLVSDLLYDSLGERQKKIEGEETVLAELLKFPPCLKHMSMLLSPEGDEIGTLSSRYKAVSLEVGILNILATPVNAVNFLTHLKIAQAVSDQLVKKFMQEDYALLSIDLVSGLLNSLAGEQLSDEKNWEKFRLLIQQVFPTPDEMSQIRIKRHHPGSRLTSTKGINARDYFTEEVEEKSIFKAHVRGSDVWRVKLTDKDSAFAKEALAYDVPLIAGASGTTARWMVLLLFMNINDNLEFPKALFDIYSANILAYMVACGHHSMHEVGYVLKKAGADYVIGNLHTLIPKEILSHKKIDEIVFQHQDDEEPSLRRSLSC